MWNLFKKNTDNKIIKHSCNGCGEDLAMGPNGGLCFSAGCRLFGVYQCYRENMNELVKSWKKNVKEN